MHKLPWGLRLALFLVLELVIGEFGVSLLVGRLHLAYLPHLVLYKVIELLVIIALSWWLVHQQVFYTRMRWGTMAALVIFWLVIGVITWHAGGIQRVIAGVATGIVAAATEELLFRGVVFGQLLKRWHNLGAAMLVSAVLFGSLHLINLTHQSGFMTAIQIMQAAAEGMMLAAMYARSGTLLAPMSFHFSLDFIAVAIHGTKGLPTGDNQLLLSGTMFWVMVYVAAAVIIIYGSKRPLRLLHKITN